MLALAAAGGSAQAAKRVRSSAPKPAPSLQAFGFTLGQRPTLLPCPTTKDGSFNSKSWSPSLDATCMESPTHGEVSADGRAKTMPVHFSHSDEPSLLSSIHARGLALQIFDGTVQSILVSTSGVDSQKNIYAMLRKKYGVPASLGKKPQENRMGSPVEGINASWVFSDLRVIFEGIGATPDEGLLSITTTASFEHAAMSPLPEPSTAR